MVVPFLLLALIIISLELQSCERPRDGRLRLIGCHPQTSGGARSNHCPALPAPRVLFPLFTWLLLVFKEGQGGESRIHFRSCGGLGFLFLTDPGLC